MFIRGHDVSAATLLFEAFSQHSGSSVLVRSTFDVFWLLFYGLASDQQSVRSKQLIQSYVTFLTYLATRLQTGGCMEKFGNVHLISFGLQSRTRCDVLGRIHRCLEI